MGQEIILGHGGECRDFGCSDDFLLNGNAQLAWNLPVLKVTSELAVTTSPMRWVV